MAEQILSLHVSLLLEVTWKVQESFLDVDLMIGKLFNLALPYTWIYEAITSASIASMVLLTSALTSMVIFRVFWNITYSIFYPCNEKSDRLFNSLGFRSKAITRSKSIPA